MKTLKADLESATTANISNQKVIKDLQETLAKNEKIDIHKSHHENEVKKKKCPKNKSNIKALNQKLTKNLANKSLSKVTKINNVKSEIITIDDEVDFNYNVEVSNIFSRLVEVPPEESTTVSLEPPRVTISRPPLPDPQQPSTPSSSSPRLPARNPPLLPPNLASSDHTEVFGFDGEFQNIRQELDKVKKILEQY